MSKIAKTNPVGIDYHIDKMQTYIFNALGWSSYDCYGRVYKNKKHGRIYKNRKQRNVIPEYCIDGHDYKEMFFTDKVDATSFFVTDDTVEIDEMCSVDVALIYQVDLKALYPTVTHRADEEMHREIALLLKENPYGHLFTGIETGIENVYDGLDFEDKYLDDMGKRHVVRFNLNIKYQYNCNN